VVYGHARQEGKVRWTFRHTPPVPQGGARLDRAEEPELPL